MLFPEQWQEFLAPIPEAERGDLLGAYHRRLLDGDRPKQLAAARAWSVWEGATSSLCRIRSARINSVRRSSRSRSRASRPTTS